MVTITEAQCGDHHLIIIINTNIKNNLQLTSSNMSKAPSATPKPQNTRSTNSFGSVKTNNDLLPNLQPTSQEDPRTNHTTTSSWYSSTSELQNHNYLSNSLTPPLLSVPHIGIIAACCAAFVSLVFLGIVVAMVIVKRRRAKSRARETTISDTIQPAMPAPVSIPQLGGFSVHNSYDFEDIPRINNQVAPPMSDLRPQKGEVHPGMTSSAQSNSSRYAYSEVDDLNSPLTTECRLTLSDEPSGHYQGHNLLVSNNNYENTYSSLGSHAREVVNPYDTFTSASAKEFQQESGNVELTRCQLNGGPFSHQGYANQPSNNYMTMEALRLQFNDGTYGNQLELGDDSPSESGEYINNFKALHGEDRLRSNMEAVETSSIDIYSQVVPKKIHNNDFYI